MKELLLTLALANTSDLISTEYALYHNSLTREGNPLLQTRSKRITFTAIKTVGEVIILNQASKHPKGKKISKIITIGITAWSSAFTVSNMLKARK